MGNRVDLIKKILSISVAGRLAVLNYFAGSLMIVSIFM